MNSHKHTHASSVARFRRECGLPPKSPDSSQRATSRVSSTRSIAAEGSLSTTAKVDTAPGIGTLLLIVVAAIVYACLFSALDLDRNETLRAVTRADDCSPTLSVAQRKVNECPLEPAGLKDTWVN